MEINAITESIIGAAIEIHRIIGPGLLESTYKKCLTYELRVAGLKVVVEQSLPLVYKDLRIERAYRTDMIVENTVVVEIKCAMKLVAVHEAQLLNYLKLTTKPVGLLINFNEQTLIQGLRRLRI
jgi:GxxExxY protein